MHSTQETNLLPFEQIHLLMKSEAPYILLSLCVLAIILYRLFLRKITSSRHLILKAQFKSIFINGLIFVFFYFGYFLLLQNIELYSFLHALSGYFGLIALAWGALVFVKASRILLMEYLYFRHMEVGVPLVLINTFTLVLYGVVFGWLARGVFKLDLGPLLATSAIFSILLGLALQDTLGNLFSGIAFQVDKAFDIGDWIEVTQNNQLWIGKVHEISWRATTLIGLADEMILIPNRVIGQSLVANYSIQHKQILRKMYFKISYSASIEKAKECLVKAAYGISKISKFPAPHVYVDAGDDSHYRARILYFIPDYSLQWAVADELCIKAVALLKESGIEIAVPRMDIEQRQKE